MTQKVNNGVRKVFRNLKAFSLVELIIVIAIVAILSVAGFLTLQKWISESRDSKRLGDLETIEKSLTVNYADSSSSELYPMSDNAEEITGDNGEIIWHQGYFGSGAAEEVSSLSKAPQDPLWTGYEYSVTADQSAFEVYAELENEKKLSYKNRVYADEEGTIVKRGNYNGYLISTNGSDYFLYDTPSIYMYSGSSLGSGEANYVYQEGEKVGTSSVVSGVNITELKDDDESNDSAVYEKIKDGFGLESVEEAEAVMKKAKGGKKVVEEETVDNVDNTSCKTLLESGKTESGTYDIDPDGDGNGFEVYCDMDDGGLTFYYVENGKATSNKDDPNSCQDKGLMLFSPTSKKHYNAGRDYVKDVLGKSKSPLVLGPLGLYSPKDGDTPSNWDDICESKPLNSYDSNNITTDGCPWTSLAGKDFWVTSHTDTEPNGDYNSGDWLYYESMDSNRYIDDFNDQNGSDHERNGTYNEFSSYLCMHEDDI